MMDGTETITTMHFVFMALLAVLTAAAIVAGARKKRQRIEAQREVEQHAEEAGVEPRPEPEPEDRTPPREPPVTPVPVAPAPPRIADTMVPGTPAAADDTPAPRPLADEPVAAATTPEGSPATIALDADAHAAEPAPADGPVTQLKGLGPKVAARLGELGIDRVGQIAALGDAEATALDAQLGAFSGRMARDRWVEQARLLAAGDRAGFERMFGRL